MLEALKERFSSHDTTWVTRKRTLGTWKVFGFLSLAIGKSLRTSIFHGSLEGLPNISASSLVRARAKIGYKVFQGSVRDGYRLFSESDLAERYKWHGLRVLAIDGSKINCPRELQKAKYKVPTSGYYPQALVSLLYDTLAGMPVNAVLSRHGNERKNVESLIKDLTENDIVLYDRGYLSQALLVLHAKTNVKCIIRCSEFGLRETIEFDNSGESEREIRFKRGDFDMRIRLIKYLIDGKKYILATNLLSRKKFKAKDICDLYQKRWQIEEGFKFIKQTLELEKFSSKSTIGVKQELYVSLIQFQLSRSIALESIEKNRNPGRPSKKRIVSPPLTSCHIAARELFLLKRGVLALKIEKVLANLNANRQYYGSGRKFTRKSRKPSPKWQPPDRRKRIGENTGNTGKVA